MTDPLDEAELLREIAKLREAREHLPVGPVEATLLHTLALVRATRAAVIYEESSGR